MTSTATLEVFQSLWAMEDLPWAPTGPRPTPWTLTEQLDLVAGHGFHGVAVDLGARRVPTAAVLAPLLGERELRCAVVAFVADDAGLDTALAYADVVGADRIVLCAQLYTRDLAAAATTVARWHRRCAGAGVELQLETHRNTLTNDLRATVALLAELDPAVLLAADLSHFVCANELPDGHDPVVEDLITAVLDRSGSAQGRIATRCQVQIPLGFPMGHTAEPRFRAWWQQGLRAVVARVAAGTGPRDGRVLFCTELGTTPYAITDGTGRELSDRWAEALVLKTWAEQAFAAALVPDHSTAPEGINR
ncbi:sugar phosphate isomerase/epimerase family protein [Nakamurella deserti]|uniref:sugar phosphate isomerase/epimerase family protein n=1 Tax=Nakamurella deserti TaxID=2164074 RepID=UPI000DBE4245|nr:hypothetical protein [Nakamurella deserti]